MEPTTKPNPFPATGTFNLESGLPAVLPSIKTDALRHIDRLLEQYLFSGTGQAVTVSGPYGSGKTHLLAYSMTTVNNNSRRLRPGVARPVQLYVKCQSSAFLSMYRSLAGQLQPGLLHFLSESMLMKVARQQAATEVLNIEARLDRVSIASERYANAPQTPEPSTKPSRPDPKTISELQQNPSAVQDYIAKSLIVPECSRQPIEHGDRYHRGSQ